MYVAASVLGANFLCLEQEIQKVLQGGADLLHLDIMDGHFVPNISFGTPVVKALSKFEIPLDIHLMVDDVPFFVDLFLPFKPKFLSFHIENYAHPIRLCEYIRSKGVGAGIVLNPHTSVKNLVHLLDYVDLVLLMSVNPGFGGQEFLPLVYEKIEQLRHLIDERGKKIFIEVDGGVNGLNAANLDEAGADILVAGSYIFNSNDYKTAINSLKCEF